MKLTRIAVVVLAAGGSSRMGRPKQLISFEDQTLIRRTVQTVRDSLADLVVVTTSENGVDFDAELKGVDWTPAPVEEAQLGQSESVRAGLQVVESHVGMDAVLFTPCDLPLLSAAHVDALIRKYLEGEWDIVASRYDDVLGAPLVVGKALWPELHTLRGDVGVRKILPLHRKKTTFVQWDEGQFDLDTPEDVAAYEARKKETPD